MLCSRPKYCGLAFSMKTFQVVVGLVSCIDGGEDSVYIYVSGTKIKEAVRYLVFFCREKMTFFAISPRNRKSALSFSSSVLAV